RTLHSFPTRRSSDLISGPEGGEKHYRRRSRASTFAGRNLDQVVRALPLAQQQVAVVEQRHLIEALLRAHGGAVGPHRALLQLARSEEHTSELQSRFE